MADDLSPGLHRQQCLTVGHFGGPQYGVYHYFLAGCSEWGIVELRIGSSCLVCSRVSHLQSLKLDCSRHDSWHSDHLPMRIYFKSSIRSSCVFCKRTHITFHARLLPNAYMLVIPDNCPPSFGAL
jgi:hypothetical protein